jgi:hypothetical protein
MWENTNQASQAKPYIVSVGTAITCPLLIASVALTTRSFVAGKTFSALPPILCTMFSESLMEQDTADLVSCWEDNLPNLTKLKKIIVSVIHVVVQMKWLQCFNKRNKQLSCTLKVFPWRVTEYGYIQKVSSNQVRLKGLIVRCTP